MIFILIDFFLIAFETNGLGVILLWGNERSVNEQSPYIHL